MKISEIDKNFATKKVSDGEFDVYSLPCEPFGLYGCYHDPEYGFIKIPKAVAESISLGVAWGARCTGGVRITFSTNSTKIGLKGRYFEKLLLGHMTFIGSSGFTLCETVNGKEEFLCNLFSDIVDKEQEFHFKAALKNDGKMHDYVIFFPLYSGVEQISVELDRDSSVAKSDKYRGKKRVMYYGSSITQGACAARPDNCYQALVSEWTDTDYCFFGFSGAAKAEPLMNEILRDTPCDVFVCDYDYNAPTAEYLKETHIELYKTFRSKKENESIPIIFLSKPNSLSEPEDKERFEIIKQTYEYALARGDKNVRLICGMDLFPADVKTHCCVDGCHPTDLGFYFMAKKVAEVLKEFI